MGTVHHLPPRLRVVETKHSLAIDFRDRQICQIAKHAAQATKGLIDTVASNGPTEAGFRAAQYDLEGALFFSCCLNGALEHDRELTTLLLKRKQERESGNASL
ncbi:hypothetical protein LAV84_06785 [Rhizobium sp. VS19-DR104.2]|nr:hypothetical protein [Rhizobium sp. VS19-DR181]MBZ5773103.1 hypothetical protein [Rhizobium sp. VS19-DRK62.2]MBZ5829412.1 hypothetical protein [Rhizobium sp. VS19-DR104.2]